MDHHTFDQQFTSDELQILKIMLPCFPSGARGGLAVWIKLMELRLTIYQVQKSPQGCLLLQQDPLSMGDTLFEEIDPFCTPEQRKKVKELRQMKEQFSNLKEMMEMAEMMQELFPQGNGMENMDFSQLAAMFGGMPFQGEGNTKESPEKPGTSEDCSTNKTL